MKKYTPIFYTSFPTLLGTTLIAWYENQISALVLPQPTFEEAYRLLNSYQLPLHDSKQSNPNIPWPELPSKINQYFQGEKVQFSEPVCIDQFPAYTQHILRITSRIPWGEVMTYQQVAHLSSQARAYRAVGQALGRNPIPLIIPCHRVVAKHSLGGFGYGLEWKSRLLSLEKIKK